MARRHPQLSHLFRDRLTVARDLLAESGSVFVQIGDENVHRVRAVMDEVFGEENACSLIAFVKTTGFMSNTLPNVADYLLWYSKDRAVVKFRQPLFTKVLGGDGSKEYTMAALPDGTKRPLSKSEKDKPETIPPETRVFRLDNLRSQGGSEEGSQAFAFEGVTYPCGPNMHWKTRKDGLVRLAKKRHAYRDEERVRHSATSDMLMIFRPTLRGAAAGDRVPCRKRRPTGAS